MNPELTLIILSRGRLQSLRRAVNSAVAYAGCSIEVRIFFDGDTATFEAYDPPLGVTKHLLIPRHYYVRGMNAAFMGVAETGVDVFAICNNDQEFIASNWAVKAKEELWGSFEFGNGVIELGNSAGRLDTFIARVPYFIEHFGGALFDSRFLQYYADTDLFKELKEREKLIYYIPGFVITHNAYDEVNFEGRQFFDEDQLAFIKKHPTHDLGLVEPGEVHSASDSEAPKSEDP